jgi:hypothetical protein
VIFLAESWKVEQQAGEVNTIETTDCGRVLPFIHLKIVPDEWLFSVEWHTVAQSNGDRPRAASDGLSRQ